MSASDPTTEREAVARVIFDEAWCRSAARNPELTEKMREEQWGLLKEVYFRNADAALAASAKWRAGQRVRTDPFTEDKLFKEIVGW